MVVDTTLPHKLVMGVLCTNSRLVDKGPITTNNLVSTTNYITQFIKKKSGSSILYGNNIQNVFNKYIAVYWFLVIGIYI